MRRPKPAFATKVGALQVMMIAIASSLVLGVILVEVNPGLTTHPKTTTLTSTGMGSETFSLTTSVGGDGRSLTVLSSNGLRLTASVNSTSLAVGQRLNVVVSISNALPVANTVAASHDWPFQGVPAALWPVCDYFLPAQVAVLKGSYDAANLSRAANATFHYECAEGGTIDHVIFRPSSDLANLTGTFCIANCASGRVGPYKLRLNFTTSGSWDLQSLSQELNIPILGQMNQGPITSTPFKPGVYTIAVADEWGQTAILHISVHS